MAKPGFYNENQNRAYPFQVGAVGSHDPADAGTIAGLPDSVIVDCGVLASLPAFYEPLQHDVWLHEIRRSGASFAFEFRSDAPGLSGHPLVFTRAVDAGDYATEHVEVTVGGQLLWSGFLVTGPLAALAALLPGDGTLARNGGGSVEPGVVQTLHLGCALSLNLANRDRTRVTAPDGCPQLVWGHPTGADATHVAAAGLVGHVRIQPGYNLAIAQDPAANTLTLSAAVGDGEGEPCDDEVALFASESAPAGSALLEGGLRCNEAIRSINGVGGRFARLVAGPGVRIQAVPDENRLICDVNMAGLAICHDG